MFMSLLFFSVVFIHLSIFVLKFISFVISIHACSVDNKRTRAYTKKKFWGHIPTIRCKTSNYNEFAFDVNFHILRSGANYFHPKLQSEYFNKCFTFKIICLFSFVLRLLIQYFAVKKEEKYISLENTQHFDMIKTTKFVQMFSD